MDYPILSKIKSPDDLKKLDISKMQPLCEEIRNCIITTVADNGGHLASNLGAVELTVALHRAFFSPEDAIIFDVGHQCYTHKLLTGRFEKFSTIRKQGGLSGFMKPRESEHDPFITGHSSNSISAAYGIYKAKRLNNESGTAVAVIGDGAMTGGMAYEALNNAGNSNGNFIVVLNDNKMSISRNVGSLARSLTKLRNKPKYHRFKFVFSKLLSKIPLVGSNIVSLLYKVKDAFKNLVYKHNIFTALGFNYLGPVDGHDVEAMESLFKIAQAYTKPSLIHVVSTKGKGYPYAELNPDNYHGVSPFDVELGTAQSNIKTFSQIAGETLCKLAENDGKICALTAAMAEGTGLSEFACRFKSRFFDVGIAEQHALTFAAGLAKGGLKPYFAVYSSFLQRSYDQIIHDAAIGNLPVRLLVDRAGIVGEDGETHQGLFDVPFLTNIPNINVYSPSNFEELSYRIEYTATLNEISAVRYPRGSEKKSLHFDITQDYSIVSGNSRKAIVTYGRLYSEACIAKKACEEINIVKLNKIYPLSDELIKLLADFDEIFIFEESQKSGAIGEHIAARLLENAYKGNFSIHAIEDEFVTAGTVSDLLKTYKLDSNAMIAAVGEK